ncbi:EAL domain-containing protein [Alteromonadaceae bacterium M269]|nr:EAL domain-containing protein [Alteromonadaceae bacterium M269]
MTSGLLKFSEESQGSKTETRDSNGKHEDCWQVLIVDDDHAIHDVTKLVLNKFQFDGRPIQLSHAYSAEEAKTILEEDNNFNVMLLDVVMETDHAGLDLVQYVRNVIKNQFLRIILRTGQPGQAPELSVIVDYDINDYKEKSELTAEKMRSCVATALRSYKDLDTIRELAQAREVLTQQVNARNKELENTNHLLKSEIEMRLDTEQQLALTNDRLESIINNSSSLISLKGIDGKYEMVNDAFKSALNLNVEYENGLTDVDLFPIETAMLIKRNDQEVINTSHSIQCEELLPSVDGEHFYLSVKFPLYNEQNVIHRVCSINTDITDRLEAQNEIIHLAHYDPLTDLPNRSLFIDRLSQAISRNQRLKKHLAVIFLDLDRFKNINDTLGHNVGDKLLVEVAKRLKSIMRSADSVCRLGGDEFAILLTDLTHKQDVIRVADKIMQLLSAQYSIEHRELIVTPSMGISRCPLDGDNVQLLLKKADVAMYKAKRAGKNAYRFYSQEDDSQANLQLSLEVDMRKMINRRMEQLVLHYQPKVDFSNGEFTSVEALIRWRHPTRGVLQPGQFIPFMEEAGLIVEVGTWVIREACEFAIRLSKTQDPLRIAVNLSSVQLKQKGLTEKLESILETTGCSPEWLEIEVTECSLIDDFEETRKTLERIAEIGIKLAIDDFGTGYSSLNYLKRLPFNTLKIDRSFIVDAPKKEQDKAIVTTIAQLAHNLNMNVVAEGVETVEQYHLVKSVASHHENNQIQGFLFSKPVPENELLKVREHVKSIWKKIDC